MAMYNSDGIINPFMAVSGVNVGMQSINFLKIYGRRLISIAQTTPTKSCPAIKNLKGLMHDRMNEVIVIGGVWEFFFIIFHTEMTFKISMPFMKS